MSNAVCHSSVAPRPRDDTHPDVRLARIAREQHGVVSIRQLAACSLDHAAVRRRTGKGRLHRVHRGVYAVGHDALTTQASFVAAVLACGDGAVLSHHTAAAYWGFRRWDGRSPQVTVTGAQRRVAGLRVHRSRRLDRRDIMRRNGILVTSPARTLLDVAVDLRPRELRRAARQAVSPDFLWPEQRLIVEADGAAYHEGALVRTHDAERQALLEAHGYHVLRITWQQAVRHPQQTRARVWAALGR